MRHDDITAILGPIDGALIVQIMQTGASADELAQAWAWLNADEAFVKVTSRYVL